MSNELVLVTGGSGFVGSHAIVQLLNAGYRVRTTVRKLSRAGEVRALVTAAGASGADSIEFVAVDLTSDAGWAEAMDGCTFVLHVASPFPVQQPKDEDELIVPARDGALRALRFARDAGVKRVVLTSSFAAVGYSPKSAGGDYTEADWTDPTQPGITPYVKSKTISERAAWDFIAREGNGLELAVVNPVGIFGPAFGTDLSSSLELMRMMLTGGVPVIPPISTSIVDVRDVASLHLLAMTHPAAAGERFLAVAGPPMTFAELASLLRDHLGPAGAQLPKRTISAGMVRFLAIFVPRLRELVPQLGQVKASSHEKATRLLGWEPRSNAEAVEASADSLVALGLVPRKGPRSA
ncbi:MAG: aldehyde reductase [Acidobacteria bacterium]|nr:aldehyde reductase [Acidobacteriota bacterium]